MARHTKITKIFEDEKTHIYEICNNGKEPDCYAVIDPITKIINFYRDKSLKEFIYDYPVLDDPNAEGKPICGLPDSHLFALSLIKLIPATRKGIYPKHLDKCS